MSQSLDEKRKTNANQKGEILEGRVIANYGDPGIDEDYHFDILSRYVVVMLESCYRVPTADKWGKFFAVVQRPRHLWVNVEGAVTENPASQRRSDIVGNVSLGLAGSYSTAGIPRINNPYRLGEVIKIKKLNHPLIVGTDSIFTSQFNNSLLTAGQYGNWHSEGSSFPYFQNAPDKIQYILAKTLMRTQDTDLFKYGITMFREHYEAFILNHTQLTNPTLVDGLVQIFTNQIQNKAIYTADGGYVFNTKPYVDFMAIEYEDINADGKQRVATNECLPLIVATPNTFPTPKTREIGTISYNPTYATVVKQ